MPIKARKSSFTYGDPATSSGLALAASAYYPSWIDMSSYDGIVVYVSGTQPLQVRGAIIDVDSDSPPPDNLNSFVTARYPSGTTITALGSSCTVIPGPLPRFIALRNSSGTTPTELLGFVRIRKIA